MLRIGGYYYKKKKERDLPIKITVLEIYDDGYVKACHGHVEKPHNNITFKMQARKVLVNISEYDKKQIAELEKLDEEFREQRRQAKKQKRKSIDNYINELLKWQEKLFDDCEIEIPVLCLPDYSLDELKELYYENKGNNKVSQEKNKINSQ